MKRSILILLVVVVLVGLGSVAMAVNIETVHVGNPGNAGDTEVMKNDGTSGYGAVNYEYDIGKYEVTAGQYCEFLNAVAKTDTYGLYNSSMDSDYRGCQITRHGDSGEYTYDFSGGVDEVPESIVSDWANRPVNCVSWGDSVRFANWLHNGQPTGMQNNTTTEDGAYDLSGTQQYYGANGETPVTSSPDWYALNDAFLAVSRESDAKWAITSEGEWYKAAYHKNDGDTDNYYDYPTGSDSIPSNILSDPNDDPGNNATYIIIPDDYTIGSPYYRTEIGAHENSESPYDTFDQGGNVWEWNEAILSGSDRGLRGGSFALNGDNLHASYRYKVYPTFEGSKVGFRVVQVPEPAMLSLLALGGLALVRRKRGEFK